MLAVKNSPLMSFVLRSGLVLLAIFVTHAAFAVDALPGPRFVGFVQESNDFEIASSQLALRKSGNENIRGFANRMIIERGEAAATLTRNRAEAGVTLAPTPGGREPRHAQILDRLAVLEGPEFDAVYASAQVAAHMEAVDQFGAYSQNGDNGGLRRYAQEMLPKLKMHLEYARRIAGQ
jgi:putative membrane protein